MGTMLPASLFLAGLAFFFVGLEQLRTNLKQAIGRRFRAFLTKWTSKASMSALVGALFGAVTQSATAVAFLLLGLVIAGALPKRRAMVAVAWANVGTVALVWVAAVDIQLLIWYLIGLSGLVLGLGIATRMRVHAGAIWSIGLLLLGLKLMKDAATPITAEPWFASVAMVMQGSLLAAFVVGAVLRLVVQSSAALVIIAMTLAHQGVITSGQVLMVQAGTGVGVALSLVMLGRGLRGEHRQLAVFQATLNAIAGVSVGLAAWATAGQWWGPLAYVIGDGGDPQARLAVAYLAQQSLCAVVGTLLVGPLERMCERTCPPAPDQDIARPRYISEAALEDPGSALELVAREHARVVELLPDALDDARHDVRGPSVSRTGDAIASLLDSIESYMRDIMSRPLSADASMHAVALDQRHRALSGLRESIMSMVQVAREARRIDPDGQGAMLVGGLVEAFDGNLRTLAEAVRGNDDIEWSVLKEMTEDRGPAMEALRGRLSEASAQMAPEALRSALYATGVFERGMWLVRQQVALR